MSTKKAPSSTSGVVAWNQNQLFNQQPNTGQTVYDTEVDVAAPEGSFSFGFQLNLQNQPIPIFTTPSGLHAETKIVIEDTGDPNAEKIAVYFNANVKNGTDISFKLTMTKLDAHLQPAGPAKSWSLSWTTSEQKPGTLKGWVPLSKLKEGSGGGKGDEGKEGKGDK